jgi:predicted PurR-regulated permease PerM
MIRCPSRIDPEKISMTLTTKDKPFFGAAAPQDPTEFSSMCDAVPSGVHALRRGDGAMQVRGLCLTILTIVATVFALHWAQKFLIPLVFGIFIAYTLNPLVAAMERMKIPRLAGTLAVMISLILCTAQAGYALRDEFMSIAERLPASAHALSRAIAGPKSREASTMQKMQAAATEVFTAAGQAAGGKAETKRSDTLAASAPSTFKLGELLWTGSVSAAGFLGQATIVVFLVFFLLLSGDTFKRKLMKLTGPSVSNKKLAVHILDEVNTSVQRYMFMLLVTNTMLAVLMWIVLRWIGLENAGAWAVAAGLLHIIPYFGPLLIAIATGLTAFMQFESVSMMLLVSVSSLVVATLVGTFVTTWMTGKIAKMNAAAVFISLLFWGWLWGVSGMLLGIPIIVIIKVSAERIEGMHAIAELLSE